jgi:hypothetical protein
MARPLRSAAGARCGTSVPESAEVETALAEAVKGAFDSGVHAERARVAEILQAPNAAHFLELAADLALGPATGEQAAKVLARAENDAATRAGLIKSNLLESTRAVLH